MARLTLMLLVGRVVEPHGNQDEEDQEWPDDLHQELQLWGGDRESSAATHTHTQTHTARPNRLSVKQEVASCQRDQNSFMNNNETVYVQTTGDGRVDNV